ncbi:MAG: gas vesicle protein GvpL, partial [Dehalococcoidia bacterium]
MSSIYAALVLRSKGWEINEANLKRVLKSLNAPVDEMEIEALITLVNPSATKGVGQQTREIKRLTGLIEALDARTTAMEERIAGMESPIVEVPEPEPMESEVSAPAEAQATGEARYLYCIADGAEEVSLGKIGIEGNEVYTIPYKDLSAVVHNCSPEPYQSEDHELVKRWVMAHQKVVETAQQRFGTVLPLGFDTIIKGEWGIDPEENMKKWLRDDYQNLKQKMERVKGKTEYGVQIFWDPKVIADAITRTNDDIKKLDQEMKAKPKGTAYMYRQRLENALKEEMEKLADKYFKDFYNRIKKHTDDVRVEKTKKVDEDKQMLMNLSCLIPKDNYEGLGEELEEILEREGISVRFTGPWPPYSFVAPG